MKVSAIVPVYNNQTTVSHVVSVLCQIPEISEVVVVDDASHDASPLLIKELSGKTPKIKTIFNPKNLGKGGAVANALKLASNEAILMCDADLSLLKPSHIQQLISTFNQGFDMVIAARTPLTNPFLRILSRLSGERIFYKSSISPYLDLIQKSGFGIEQIINFAHKRSKVKVIISQGIGHVLKLERSQFPLWLADYGREVAQIVKTQYHLHRFPD